MTTFWILTALLAVLVAALLVLALLRGVRDTRAGEAFDMQIYRDQLTEVERDRARGVIGEEEAERLRTEVSRRLLAADQKARAAASGDGQPRGPGLAMAGLIAALVLGGAYGLYARLGAPGYGDLGLSDRIARAAEARASRPSQAEAEAQAPASAAPEASEEYRDLVQRLRGAVAERPDDLQGYRLLARSEAALGNFAAAHAAQARILALLGDGATAKNYADLGDMMVLAAGGYVSPEAERAFEAALSRDPQNGVARYYAGLLEAQTGRPDRAFRIWDELLRDSRADDPWVEPVTGQIGSMAQRAGVANYSPPQPAGMAPGPSGDDIAAAQDMDPEARMEMIRGMVARLSERLETEGGSAEEWARLIGALAVMGQAERAMETFAEAETVFADDPEGLRLLREAAQGAGIGQ
ncbi:c-type cytochrome biogenesis protein CcmI [Roseivivax isoporae]|uniref:Cytochrome C n=1 Tax=Roseivivax isoporae LMG 25204 TaxID=1449351 RepID=X7F9W0_9RHOB|nr:c-type cytochrome biogenesis protein CcmI [Roseivivax isoporae]ETX29565.1 cytochrome C [Roseivivax isoporae LMG 25204]